MASTSLDFGVSVMVVVLMLVSFCLQNCRIRRFWSPGFLLRRWLVSCLPALPSFVSSFALATGLDGLAGDARGRGINVGPPGAGFFAPGGPIVLCRESPLQGDDTGHGALKAGGSLPARATGHGAAPVPRQPGYGR
ncbi:hypothetical protein Tbd_1816 [Thiobacillus denitrificans ATCC 25259]|uniref:Uncharacterized protein n=1 Tax=Thiobacillus denitrificans (strain ATCC 25259 / T1) TaxID=292415 RepID=Q3SHW4_THIDA|nr:hypothetical protein Tbd_1816 [Thiobacillus denitrificans ATCC 25259]